ncbi:MAG: 50S ribosomal protein L14 [Candidatus Diapherotrites archaeon]|nr:50S ribosomal protein L14 [Candidatus Diapherotrites archaeon]
MKALPANITKGIITGTRLVCADNSGAKELEVIGVKGYKGRKRRYPAAGLGDMVICSVKKGKVSVRKQKVKAVIIRQKRAYKRPNGTRVKFWDNAAILVNDDGIPKGSEIKGPAAKEVGVRWPKVAGIAPMLF